MLVIENLIPIVSNGSALEIPHSRNIFTKDGNYYVNFCHGDKTHGIGLDMNNQMFQTDPQNFRIMIYDQLGYLIPDERKVIIMPCYPKSVLQKYGDLFKKYNIEVIGNWDEITWSSFFDGKTVLTPQYKNNNIEQMSIFIRSYRLPEREEWRLIYDVFFKKINIIKY